MAIATDLGQRPAWAAEAPAAKLAAASTGKDAAAKAKIGAPKASDPLKGTPLARPTAATPDEAEYVRALDQAIAAARATSIPVEDATRIRDAFAAISARNLQQSSDIQAQVTDPVGRKLIEWYRLRSGYGEPAQFRAFLDANPAWADRSLLNQRFEEALFIGGGASSAIKAQFSKTEPKTGVGMAALASALLADGDSAKAQALAARAWRDTTIPATLEQGFLDRFKPLLTEADHKWKLDRLLMDDIRWTAERNDKAAFVRRLIPLLGAAAQKKANARLAVYLRSADARKLIEALPAEADTDWGLVLSRIQLARRNNQNDEAAKLMLGAPTDAAKIVSPDDWWDERRANAYEALDAGKPKLAYDLVHAAGPLSVNPLKEQTFMAGWLAFRFLRDPASAERHFTDARKAADGPLSRAKADYWLGRIADAQGDSSKAQDFWRRAATETDTFHGQLARQRLEPGRRAIELKPPALPTPDQISRFNSLDAVKAAVIARKSGLDVGIVRGFLNQLRSISESEAEVGMVAHLAEALGDTQGAVRIAKSAVARGQNLLTYAYPVHPFPSYTALRQPPEAALLLAIARQESEFNSSTVSGAGARGLLQVMPITAKHVCRDYKIPCDIPRLLTDISYNTSIASAYIADRMGEFQGSYVLGIAGYNAGPGRARQWIRQFGDPRDPKVDVIDWIERIPFQETREYVAKVLSNVQIYRSRLGEKKTALRLEEDLMRAKLRADAEQLPLPPPVTAPAAGRAAAPLPDPASANN